MPNRMRIPVFIPQIEKGADGIQDRANTDKDEHGMRQLVKEFPAPHDQDPAHSQINDGGNDFKPASEPDLKNDPYCGKPPEDGKEGHTKGIVDIDEQKGGIGPGDKKVDAD